jgi:uncharacterized phage protein gp47/JayE
MQLQLQTFTTLLAAASAAVQAAARTTLDLTVGSALRAILEANAATALWMQWLIVQVLQTTRAATSTGADLDSWVADFSLLRLPATQSTGQVIFSRFSAQGTTSLTPGTIVRTGDGAQSFTILTDPTNPAFAAATQTYVLGDGIATISVPVQAVTPGVEGNVQAGAVSLMASAVPGIDTVINATSFGGGLAVEADAALRDRFRNYIATRSRATPLAIFNAVASVRQGLRVTIRENMLPDGTPSFGTILINVDDGSGVPSPALLASIATAVENVRPAGTSFAVLGPAVLTVNVQLAIAVSNMAYDTAAGAIAASVTAWIAALPLGATLPVSRIAQLAYDTNPGITNVTGVTLNGSPTDLAAPPGTVLHAGSVTVL